MLLADRILVVTGVRSFGSMFSFCRRLTPARQLWHAVSAIALIVVDVGVLLGKFGFMGSSILTFRLMMGCGFELPLIHFCWAWSYMWWLMAWRLFGCHWWVDALQASWMYGSLSLILSISFKSSSIDAIAGFSFFSLLHTLAKWFGIPQLPQFFPNAGHTPLPGPL